MRMSARLTSAVAGDDLDGADDVVVERFQFLCRNPELFVLPASVLMHFVSRRVVACTRKVVTNPANPEAASLTFQSRAICVAYSTFSTG